jgi:ParB-like chromosome segregation protein Spo0J
MPETVNTLAASMRASGLINPVIVKRATVYDGAVMVQGYKVVAGNHRVAAARALEWAEIDAFVVDGDGGLEAELIEIDENLCRADLTAAQRASAIKRRKEVWAALHPELSAESADKRGPGRPVSFAKDTMDKTGESDRRTREHLARAEALGDDLEAVVGTSLDKGVELDALKDMDADKRRELIERARAGEAVSARERDPQQAARLVSIVVGDFSRMLGKVTPDEVAEAISKQVLNPDLHPFVEAVFNGYRASRKKAA